MSASLGGTQRARTRALTVRVGLAILLATFAAACIFEQSTYEGGGRRDDSTGEPDAGEGQEEPAPAPTTSTTSTATNAPEAGTPPADAGAG